MCAQVGLGELGGEVGGLDRGPVVAVAVLQERGHATALTLASSGLRLG